MPTTKISREEILRRAWRLFHRHGYFDTSLQMVATATGLGKAGLLHHFGSKRGLMEAVIDFARDWYAEHVLNPLREPLPLEDQLRTFLNAHVQLCQLDRRGCFFANTILETGADHMFSTQLGQFTTQWQSAVAERLSERFPHEEARERAYRLFIEYEGSVVLYKMLGDVSHLERFVERAISGLHHPLNQAE